MPYDSPKQRKFMYAKHPEIAKRYEKEGKAYVKKSDKPKGQRKGGRKK